MKIALCSGSFDPVTNGHIDIITRASKLFDKVIVGVAENYDKVKLFTLGERRELLIESLKDIYNVDVMIIDGLVSEFAKKNKVNVIVRGIRSGADYDYELRMSLVNKKLNDNIETIFLAPDPNNMCISSSLVKQVASLNGDFAGFIPKVVLCKMNKKLYKGGRNDESRRAIIGN